MVRLVTALLLLPSLTVAADTWPVPHWPQASPAEVGLDEVRLCEARDYALTGGGSGYVTRYGKLVMTWGDLKQRNDLKSTTKSIGMTAVGLCSSTAS